MAGGLPRESGGVSPPFPQEEGGDVPTSPKTSEKSLEAVRLLWGCPQNRAWRGVLGRT